MILPLETLLAINRLGIGGNQKWHYRGKRAGRKVKERCARNNKYQHELIPVFSKRHQTQKTGSPVFIVFQNVSSLNNKVLELIQNHMDGWNAYGTNMA